MTRPYRKTSLRNRFWKHVDVRGPDDCWEWQGSRNALGYGRVQGDYTGTRNNLRFAHRVSLWIAGAPVIRDGFCVLHSCDNPPCVNPAHLRLGTRADNVNDCKVRGRSHLMGHKGETNTKSKLSVEQVLDARRRYAGGETQASIAQDLEVSQVAVSKIVRRIHWGHVSPLR